MKRILFTLIFPVAVFAAFMLVFYKYVLLDTNSFFYWSFCDTPVHYSIGTVDQRFNLSQREFLSDTQDAAIIWSHTQGKQLFVYDTKGSLKINLVFDQRQSLTEQINSLENGIKTDKSSLDPQIAEYERLVLDFKKRVTTLNDEIAFWNSKGGAPQDEYEKIIKEQTDIQEQANRLNAMAKALNQSTQAFNGQIATLHQTIQSFNEVLQLTPEEGIYNAKDNTIDIYFNVNQTELIHTVAHELGHALGLGHAADPNAIMYPFTTQQIIPSASDIAQLEEVCKKYTLAELVATRFSIVIQQHVSKYQQQ